jgi:hypothetical protein
MLEWRLRLLILWAAAMTLASAAVVASDPDVSRGRRPPDSGNAAQVGRWSVPIDLHVTAIHSALLPGGDVVLFSYPAPGKRGSDTWVWNSGTGTSRQVPTVPRRDVFCSGHSFLADGRLFVTGGAMWGSHLYLGALQTSFFDPHTETWQPGPDMRFPRWYPTNLTLPDGDVLIVAGADIAEHDVPVIERFMTASGSIERLPARADKTTNEYPRLHLLPDGKVLLAGQSRETALFDPATGQRTEIDEMGLFAALSLPRATAAHRGGATAARLRRQLRDREPRCDLDRDRGAAAPRIVDARGQLRPAVRGVAVRARRERRRARQAKSGIRKASIESASQRAQSSPTASAIRTSPRKPKAKRRISSASVSAPTEPSPSTSS